MKTKVKDRMINLARELGYPLYVVSELTLLDVEILLELRRHMAGEGRPS